MLKNRSAEVIGDSGVPALAIVADTRSSSRSIPADVVAVNVDILGDDFAALCFWRMTVGVFNILTLFPQPLNIVAAAHLIVVGLCSEAEIVS